MTKLSQSLERIPVVLRVLNKLETVLQAELNGDPFDPGEAARLADDLTRLCPDIRYSLRRVVLRMREEPHLPGRAAKACAQLSDCVV